MDKQSKAITTRLNQLAGVKEPEGRNGFKKHPKPLQIGSAQLNK